MPPPWVVAAAKLARHPDADVRDKALQLSLIFGDADAAGHLRRRLADKAIETQFVLIRVVNPKWTSRLAHAALEAHAQEFLRFDRKFHR